MAGPSVSSSGTMGPEEGLKLHENPSSTEPDSEESRDGPEQGKHTGGLCDPRTHCPRKAQVGEVIQSLQWKQPRSVRHAFVAGQPLARVPPGRKCRGRSESRESWRGCVCPHPYRYPPLGTLPIRSCPRCTLISADHGRGGGWHRGEQGALPSLTSSRGCPAPPATLGAPWLGSPEAILQRPLVLRPQVLPWQQNSGTSLAFSESDSLIRVAAQLAGRQERSSSAHVFWGSMAGFKY